MRCLKLFSIGLVSVLVCLGPAGCGNPQQKKYEPVLTVHTYQIDGLTVRTGDLICTNLGEEESVFGGLVWQLLGTLVPGEVDHIAVYVGPSGRCVEAGAKFCVATFDIKDNTWDSSKMVKERGPLRDNLYGVAYPLAGLSLSSEEEAGIRKRVAMYCIRQAEANKQYNALFLDSKTEDAFYCSQLPYKAYLKEGIDLNTGKGVQDFPGMESIVFPQEIWSGCKHEKASARASR
ncbi:MAG: hypothetical protein JSV99_05050 [Planctomycetota bacterium]|nr:MAG: hypothetical protein JSV99_05050 [Planctomycetota bacterium]